MGLAAEGWDACGLSHELPAVHPGSRVWVPALRCVGCAGRRRVCHCDKPEPTVSVLKGSRFSARSRLRLPPSGRLGLWRQPQHRPLICTPRPPCLRSTMGHLLRGEVGVTLVRSVRGLEPRAGKRDEPSGATLPKSQREPRVLFTCIGAPSRGPWHRSPAQPWGADRAVSPTRGLATARPPFLGPVQPRARGWGEQEPGWRGGPGVTFLR